MEKIQYKEQSIENLYKIKGQIGSGTFYKVFEAEEIQEPHRKVALRVLDLAVFFLSNQGQYFLTLLREIKTFELKHPNIVENIDCFIDQNQLVSVFELATYGLDKLIESYKQDGVYMTNVQICQIMIHILMGLEYTHSKGTIHRDISADNILFCAEQGLYKLADFGVATFGTTVNYGGKHDYMAPEVKEQKHYNYKADIWSSSLSTNSFRSTQRDI
ncbi:pak-related kinase shk2 [Stylonychia lemnae]|uniref:Pak-related kinase shk2 n=1 Tax=Stylonychia lemnae TaxID=5949 RepID=A0A078AQL7_STYLE|nr:pak-related kinase shk2 [Stylonychia lemnae]|eukprot:CDW84479.1 pak-related kinase shk2 [Stylonychia lemnae]